MSVELEYTKSDTGEFVDQNGKTPHGRLAICDMAAHELTCALCKTNVPGLRYGLTMVLWPTWSPVCDDCAKKYTGRLFVILQRYRNKKHLKDDAMEGAWAHYKRALDKAAEEIVINGCRFKYNRDENKIQHIE